MKQFLARELQNVLTVGLVSLGVRRVLSNVLAPVLQNFRLFNLDVLKRNHRGLSVEDLHQYDFNRKVVLGFTI